MNHHLKEKPRSTAMDLLWMGAIWTGSVLTLGVVAMGFRALMSAVGMSSH